MNVNENIGEKLHGIQSAFVKLILYRLQQRLKASLIDF